MSTIDAFQSLIDTVQGALLLATPDGGTILSANQLAAILLATPHDDMVGKSFAGFLANPDDGPALLTLLAANSMVYNRKLALRTATGRKFEVQMSLREVRVDNMPTLVISFSDRTESMVMNQLLDAEHQLVEQSLTLYKAIQQEKKQGGGEDKLTGVVGMPQLLGQAHAETGRIRRYGGSVAALSLQLLNMPALVPEDDNGSARRHLLQLAGSLCVQSTRDSDLVARREDDSFVILLPNTSLDGAHDLARRLILTLRQLTFVYQGKEEQADSCAGISVVRDDENSPNPMLERLSGALSLARIGGAGHIHRQG